MPVYAYHCDACGTDLDSIRPMCLADADERCPTCGALMRRMPTAPAIIPDQDWSGENGGRGRRILSLGSPTKPAYFRSLRDAKAYGDAHGIPYET